jgi:hypothetical protein
MSRIVAPRWVWFAAGMLAAAVVVAAIYFPRLRSNLQDLRTTQETEEQARRAVIQAPIVTPTDVNVNARMFWASAKQPGALEGVDIKLPLSADPVQRSMQLINALASAAPSAAQRTLPPDTTLLAFYLLPDGTAIADFADTLAAGTPSGILSEQLTVESIVQTLAAGVPQIRRLKILLHGQETDTLAGHLDLTGFFAVNAAPSRVELSSPAAAPAQRPN